MQLSHLLVLVGVLAAVTGAAAEDVHSLNDEQWTSQVLPAVDLPLVDSTEDGVPAAAATAPQVPHLKAVSEKDPGVLQIQHAEAQRMRQPQQGSFTDTEQLELLQGQADITAEQQQQQQQQQRQQQQQQQQNEVEHELQEKVNHVKMGTAVAGLLSKMPAAAASEPETTAAAAVAAAAEPETTAVSTAAAVAEAKPDSAAAAKLPASPDAAAAPDAAATAPASTVAAPTAVVPADRAVLEVAAAPAAYATKGSDVVTFKVSQDPLPSRIISVSESQAKVVNGSKAAGNAAARPGAAAAGAVFALLAAVLCCVV